MNSRTKELDNCLCEAESIIFDLKRKVRLAKLNEKKRVNKTKYLNIEFENVVKQVDSRIIHCKDSYLLTSSSI